MKESKVIIIGPEDDLEATDKVIKTLEREGWEVAEHRLSATSTELCSRVYASLLFQREKV